jgi:hypothetical protein
VIANCTVAGLRHSQVTRQCSRSNKPLEKFVVEARLSGSTFMDLADIIRESAPDRKILGSEVGK